MKRPNWFDESLGDSLEKATAEQAMAEIAKSPRVVSALKDALAAFDSRGPMPGPSRSQVIRDTLAEVLQADS